MSESGIQTAGIVMLLAAHTVLILSHQSVHQQLLIALAETDSDYKT